jgi:hypothetical protein
MLVIVSATSLCKLLHSAQFHFSNEYDLQAGIAKLLTDEGVAFEREVRINKQDRLDFLTAAGIAIEVKVDGTLASVTRQLYRYATRPEVNQIILVTTRSKHRQLPQAINGKPLYLVQLSPLL